MISGLMRARKWLCGAYFITAVMPALASVQTDCTKVLPLKSAAAEKLKVALVPFKIDGLTALPEFLAKIDARVNEAANNGAGLIVFPELFIADLVEASERTTPLLEQMKKLAQESTPKIVAHFKELAQRHKVVILGGTMPRQVGKEIRNTAVLATAAGEIFYQDKLFLTPDEKDWAWQPGSELKVFEAPWGRTVILTCYDSEFAKVSEKLSALAPELILVPSMTDTVEGFRRVRWTSQARAIEHRAYVVHVGTTGEPDPSWPNYAQASVLTPSEKSFPGLLVEGAVNSDRLVYAELDFKKLREARRKVGIYPACEEKARKKPIAVATVKVKNARTGEALK